MEEDIKILEDFINNEFQKDKLEMNEKGGFKIGTIYKVAELSPAIENLIKAYKEQQWLLEYKEADLEDSIPKSLIKEKIEELDNMINEINKGNLQRYTVREILTFKRFYEELLVKGG